MYYGEKVCLRAYKEEDIPIATKFVNDGELKYYDEIIMSVFRNETF